MNSDENNSFVIFRPLSSSAALRLVAIAAVVAVAVATSAVADTSRHRQLMVLTTIISM